MVRGLQKGEIDPSSVSKKVRDTASKMRKSDVKDFAATKHKGLPKKKKKAVITKEGMVTAAIYLNKVADFTTALQRATMSLSKIPMARSRAMEDRLKAMQQQSDQRIQQVQSQAQQYATQAAQMQQLPSPPAAQPPYGAQAAAMFQQAGNRAGNTSLTTGGSSSRAMGGASAVSPTKPATPATGGSGGS